MCSDMVIKVKTGNKCVGEFIGLEQDRDVWFSEKVDNGFNSVNCLSKAAEQYPHSAYTIMTNQPQREWGYIQRIISGVKSYFKKSFAEHFSPKNVFT